MRRGHATGFIDRTYYENTSIINYMSLLRIESLTKRFGTKTALDSINLEIPQGQIFGLLGPNGAGKTTLIRAINRILIPTEGCVYFQDHPITEEDVRRIGYLPEERGLYRKMKVGDQAMYFAQLKGMSSYQAREELKKWFIKFGIQDWWGKKVEELSKGMAQKVQFITTVVHNPKLMILDEPFSGFDPVNAQLIRDEILALKEKGATIILSTHNMESVEELCDNIALINKSKVVVNGGVEQIRREYGDNSVLVGYRDAEGDHEQIVALRPDYGTNDVLMDFINKGVQVTSFKEMIPRMNDIFIKLVKEGE